MSIPKRDPENDMVALVDLDGTVADYDSALRAEMAKLCAPNESPYKDRYTGGTEPPYIEARRKLIQRQPDFWRTLEPLPAGFDIVRELRNFGFHLHVLTKGPVNNSNAWAEKVAWCRLFLPEAAISVTTDKALSYGRILVDDYPPYFLDWLKVRPRGQVICVAHPWNKDVNHPRVFRYDRRQPSSLADLAIVIDGVRKREAGHPSGD